jgi:two-component system sensor histidine kinase FlrB
VENDAHLLRQLEKLNRVYRTLTHELQTPLGAVMLNLDLLQENLDGDGRWNRGGADRAAPTQPRNRRSRDPHPDRGDRERFDLAGSLRDLAALLAPQARRQSVELELRLEDDLLPVRGYPDRLHQAFLNVAVNALEACLGGPLARSRRVDPGQIALRDTGPASAAALPRVCDLDFTTKDGGSGIGLYVARAVVELHGGEIGVVSRFGYGTAVLVAVPLVSGRF